VAAAGTGTQALREAPLEPIRFRLVYDGAGPVHWCRRPDAFGLQDKAAVLHPGAAGPGGVLVFDFALQLKAQDTDAPVFTGDFAHGPPAARFLYLGWRDARGAFARRLKLPLAGIGWDAVRAARERRAPLVATLVDHHPRATSTGANVGGSRPVAWALP